MVLLVNLVILVNMVNLSCHLSVILDLSVYLTTYYLVQKGPKYSGLGRPPPPFPTMAESKFFRMSFFCTAMFFLALKLNSLPLTFQCFNAGGLKTFPSGCFFFTVPFQSQFLSPFCLINYFHTTLESSDFIKGLSILFITLNITSLCRFHSAKSQ